MVRPSRLMAVSLVAALAMLSVPRSSTAIPVPYTGMLSIEFPSPPAPAPLVLGPFPGAGTASAVPFPTIASLFIPGYVSTPTPSGFLGSIPTPFPVSGFPGICAAGPVFVANPPLAFGAPALCSIPHLGVTCPGGGLGGFAPLAGGVGLVIGAACPTFPPTAVLSVPTLGPVGGGSTFPVPVLPLPTPGVLSGAGWTVGTVGAGGFFPLAAGTGPATTVSGAVTVSLVSPFFIAGPFPLPPLPGIAKLSLVLGPTITTSTTTTTGVGTTSTTTTTTTTTSTTTTTTLVALCGASPEPDGSCRLADSPGGDGKSSILMKNKADDTKDQLKWKWKKGVATDAADFLSPDTGTATMRLCVYDSGGKLAELDLPAGGTVPTCDGKPCWKVNGSGTTFKYKNKPGSPSGITGAKLKAGAAGKAQVQVAVKGKGGFYSSPATDTLVPDVVVQLLIDDGFTTECFKTAFPGSSGLGTIKKQDAENFKAKGP
jgi:hypothetical protein